MSLIDVVETIDLELALAGLLGNYEGLGARLRVLSHNVACPLTGVTLRVYYPAFRSGKPTDHDLSKAISHYITHFALHRTQRERVYEKCEKLSPDDRAVEYSKLRAKAVSTFIKAHKLTKRNGEAGELMLFLLTEWILKAPQILAKMSLKTEPEMAVHGADGIHVAFDAASHSLRFYLGEAKIYQDLSSALVSAAQSIANALAPSEIDSEIELVERHIDTTGLDEDTKNALLLYLDPFEEKGNLRREVITAFVAFSYDGYSKIHEASIDNREGAFLEALEAELAKIATKVADALSAAGVKGEEVEFFLMPLPSVAALRENFQAQIGWKSG